MKTNILLIGARGYVGMKLHRAFIGAKWNVTTVSRSGLYNTLRTPNTFFDVVVNAAGYCGKPNVDACLSNRADVLEDNLLLPTILADYCRKNDLPLIHLSSGCIYSGTNDEDLGFTELDEPNFSFTSKPAGSLYSGSKAAAEIVVRRWWKHHILRLRMPFNGEKSNRNLLSKLLYYDRLVNVNNSLTQVDEFVSATVLLMQRALPYGTWNMVNPEPITTAEVCMILQKHIPHKFSYFDSYEDFEATVLEPRSSCVLSNKKARDHGMKFSNTRTAIEKAAIAMASSR